MDALVGEYIRSWNPNVDAWTKRGDAADFSLFLAGELGISPKGIEIDKDGKLYRVLIPIISRYWVPPSSELADWQRHLAWFKKEMKSWASA